MTEDMLKYSIADNTTTTSIWVYKIKNGALVLR